jgi:hypothetical protein
MNTNIKSLTLAQLFQCALNKDLGPLGDITTQAVIRSSVMARAAFDLSFSLCYDQFDEASDPDLSFPCICSVGA